MAGQRTSALAKFLNSLLQCVHAGISERFSRAVEPAGLSSQSRNALAVAVRLFRRASKHIADHDLAVSGPDTGDQDLVCSCVKGAAATARRGPVATSTTAKAAASTPTWKGRAAS